MFSKVNILLNRFLHSFLILLTAAILIIITYQVFGRYVLNSAPSWTEETARIILVWISMTGAAVLVRKRTNIKLDFIVKAVFSEQWNRFIGVIIDCLIIFFATIIFYLGIKHSIKNIHYTTEALHLPMVLLTGTIPVSAFFMIFFGVENLFDSIRLLLKYHMTTGNSQ